MTLVQQYQRAQVDLSNYKNIFLQTAFQPGDQDYTWVGGYPFPKNKPWGIYLYKISEYFYGDMNYARLYIIYESGNRSNQVLTCLKIYQTYYEILEECHQIDDTTIMWRGVQYTESIDQIAMQQYQNTVLKQINFKYPIKQIHERSDSRGIGNGFTYPGSDIYTKLAKSRYAFTQARNMLNYSIMQSGSYQEPSVLVQNVQVIVANGGSVEGLDINQIANQSV